MAKTDRKDYHSYQCFCEQQAVDIGLTPRSIRVEVSPTGAINSFVGPADQGGGPESTFLLVARHATDEVVRNHSGSVWSLGRIFFLAIVSAIIVLIGPSTSLSRGQEVDPEQFLKEYRSAIKSLENLARSIRFEGTLTRQTENLIKPGPPKIKKENLAYVRNNNKEKFVIEGDSDGSSPSTTSDVPKGGDPISVDYFERTFVLGEDRSFILRRAVRGGPYYLEIEAIPKNHLLALDNCKRVTVDAVCRSSISGFSDLVNSREFSIKRCRKESDEKGRALFRIDFEHKPVPVKTPSGRPNALNTIGTILLDPSLQMAIRESDVRKVSPNDSKMFTTTTAKIQYADGSGLPVPTEITCNTNSSNRVKSSYVFKVNRWDYASTTEEKFTLDSYGLGDLEHPVGQGRSWHETAIIVFIVSGIGFLISLVVWRRRK